MLEGFEGAVAVVRGVFTHPEHAHRYRSWRTDIDRSLAETIEGSPPPPVLW
jgi:hypothetical protein